MIVKAKILPSSNEREFEKVHKSICCFSLASFEKKKLFFLKKSKTTILASPASFQTLKWAQLFLSLHKRFASHWERHLNGALCACTAYKPIHAFPVLRVGESQGTHSTVCRRGALRRLAVLSRRQSASGVSRRRNDYYINHSQCAAEDIVQFYRCADTHTSISPCWANGALLDRVSFQIDTGLL